MNVHGQRTSGPAAARLIRNFQPTVIPGLLQTAEYTRSVLALGKTTDRAAALAARLERQQVLHEPGRRFEFVISEQVLRWAPGPLAQAGQIDRLLSLMTLESRLRCWRAASQSSCRGTTSSSVSPSTARPATSRQNCSTAPKRSTTPTALRCTSRHGSSYGKQLYRRQSDCPATGSPAETLTAHLSLALETAGSTLTDIHGLGPILAAKIVAHSGDITRFPSLHHYASYCGTAPIEAPAATYAGTDSPVLETVSSTQQCTSWRSQARDPGPGRDHYRRKLTEAKTPAEARRSLKRQLSNVIYKRLLADHQRALQASTLHTEAL